MSDSVRLHRQQPTRLRCPWDSPGKNTGVGCHFLLHCVKLKSESEVTCRVWLFVTPWTAAYQAPPSMGFSRQEYFIFRLHIIAPVFFRQKYSYSVTIQCFKQKNKGISPSPYAGVFLSPIVFANLSMEKCASDVQGKLQGSFKKKKET